MAKILKGDAKFKISQGGRVYFNPEVIEKLARKTGLSPRTVKAYARRVVPNWVPKKEGAELEVSRTPEPDCAEDDE